MLANDDAALAYSRALGRLLEVPSSPRLGLERMSELLSALGHPQRQFQVLHVAGTNGKGSVCAFLAALLHEAGSSYGVTTSPHLTSATERIAVQGEPIGEDEFVALEARVFEAAASMADRPTFFERMIAMALVSFADHGVRWAVVEVGLGGRLDATNVLAPAATAITSVSLDHQQFLGDTLAAIAFEKAGILKANVPAVSAPQHPDAGRAIQDHAKVIGARLDVVGKHLILGDTEAGYEVRKAGRLLAAPFQPTLAGFHQAENAAVALGMVEAAGILVGGEHLEARRRALESARWPGRFEVLSTEGATVVLDGAHNPGAARALAATLRTHPASARRPVVALVGATRGHDPEAFGAALQPPPDETWTTRARAPRSIDAHLVCAGLQSARWPRVRSAPLDEALQSALARAQKLGATLLVTGSLYLVGEIRARLLTMREDPFLPDF